VSGSPLAGRTVLVTRPADRARRLVKQLDELGARPIMAPTIELRPARSAALTAALKDLAAGRLAWIVLTSPSTVAMLADRLGDPAAVRARAAAIGDGTAEAYARWSGQAADLRPRSFTTEALARSFPRGQGRVLCARADIAPEGLEAALAAKGWSPVRVDAYRTAFPARLPAEAREALAAGDVDAVTFTSASTVRGFVGAVDAVRGSPKVVCIGPVTAKEARAHGFTVHAVADPHTTDGLLAALERVFRPRRRATP
jgi:uroporphyrinogen-III synthase